MPRLSDMPEVTRPADIRDTLEERGKRYGAFTDHACLSQRLKHSMQTPPACWDRLSTAQKEALEMIVHKIARILNGDPNFHDSWHDIVGYAQLVADTLAPREVETRHIDAAKYLVGELAKSPSAPKA